MKLKKPITLVGMMGAGKSSFGRKIAKKLNAQFFDLDNEMKTKTGYSPKEIFNYFGENMLKDSEFEAVEEIIQKAPNSIIATGDSTIDNKRAWDFLKQNTITIWLNIDLKLISIRLKPNEDRPYLDEQNDNMLTFITQLYHKRAQKYKQAHLTIHRPILNKKTFLKKLMQMIEKLQSNQQIDINAFFEEFPTKEQLAAMPATSNNRQKTQSEKKKKKKFFKKKSTEKQSAE